MRRACHLNNYGGGVPRENSRLAFNAGLFKKTTRGNYTIAVAFHNMGTVSVEAGSLTFLNASGNTGTLSVSNGATLIVGGPFTNLGTLKGNGTFTRTGGTPLNNSGTISPGNSPGSITINGNYEQTATGTYKVELASSQSFDTLHVMGGMKLDGTLNIVSLGGYNPVVGDTFTIATFDDSFPNTSDLTGSFVNLVWNGFAPGIGFAASYFAHSVVLKIAASVAGSRAAGSHTTLRWLLIL